MPISLSGSLNLSGSLTTTGTITATTLVVQTITSSISSITGSTNFGSLSINNHTFTGSLLVSGSGTFTGSIGTTALNMNNMSALGSISGGSIYLPSTAKINFRSADGTTGYGEITADTSSNLIFKNNVGIGMTPDVNLQVKAISGNNTTFRIGPSASGFELSQDNGGFTVCTIKNIYGSTSTSAELSLQSGFITFKTGTSSTEYMRIQSDGTVLAGTTNDAFFNGSVTGTGLYGSNGFIAASRGNSTCAFFNRFTSTGDIVQFRYAGSNVGTISTNGSTITFSGNAVSDARLKNNIQPITNALDAINAAEFVTFKFKENNKDSAGVTAQNLQTIEKLSPFVINGITEEDYKAVDYNALIGYMGKAIQELTARVQYLENK